MSKHFIQNTQGEISALASVLVYWKRNRDGKINMKAPMVWQKWELALQLTSWSSLEKFPSSNIESWNHEGWQKRFRSSSSAIKPAPSPCSPLNHAWNMNPQNYISVGPYQTGLQTCHGPVANAQDPRAHSHSWAHFGLLGTTDQIICPMDSCVPYSQSWLVTSNPFLGWQTPDSVSLRHQAANHRFKSYHEQLCHLYSRSQQIAQGDISASYPNVSHLYLSDH